MLFERLVGMGVERPRRQRVADGEQARRRIGDSHDDGVERHEQVVGMPQEDDAAPAPPVRRRCPWPAHRAAPEGGTGA
jgi:hypothetical protein